jgi:hypothetical protein
MKNQGVIEDLSIARTGEAMGTVTTTETNRAGSIDGHDEVDSPQTVAVVERERLERVGSNATYRY